MIALCFVMLSATLVAVAGLDPKRIRVDLASSSSVSRTPFITLDNVTGSSLAVSVMWELSSDGAQTAFCVNVSMTGGPLAWSSGIVNSSAQLTYFPRATLTAESLYAVTVAVRDVIGIWTLQNTTFLTSASAASWAMSSPIWAAQCNHSSAVPSFARFLAFPSIPMAASDSLHAALVYATGAPPIYNDNVSQLQQNPSVLGPVVFCSSYLHHQITKLLGGYFLSVNGTRLGVGPGRNSCGPFARGPCK
jgi:hypothetical protein